MKTRIITGAIIGAMAIGAAGSTAGVPSKLLNGSPAPDTDPLVQQVKANGHTFNEVLDPRRIDRGRAKLAIGVGAHVACIAVQNYDGSGSNGCAPVQLDKPAISVDLLPGGKYQVSGMVNNTVAGLKVNGVPASIENGVFSVEVDSPQSVSWVVGGKEYSQKVSG